MRRDGAEQQFIELCSCFTVSVLSRCCLGGYSQKGSG